MDHAHHTVRLYTAQASPVLAAMERDGACFNRAEYVERKYAESSAIFLTAYRWFAAEAAKRVHPPVEGILPYWVFGEKYSVDTSGGGTLLTLDVPREEAVFFDLYDWQKILCLKPLFADAAAEQAFMGDLRERGVTVEQVMLSAFYPELKAEIMKSWERLFRHHEAIKAGNTADIGGLQAALWCIKKDWIVE